MEGDLANLVDGIAERLVPEEMRGQLVEAEHLSRYWWAASLVAGKRVLDAGCGTGYGSAILARAGAAEVIGVDVAGDVLDAVRPAMPPEVRLEQADVSELPFEDGSFEVVVCFEVIEHVEDAETALNEFARVLAEDGVLAISSPNRGVYMPGNPHHRHEFVPEELQETLARRFSNVRLFRQADWMTAGVLSDDLHALEGETPLDEIQLRKAVAGELGGELYTLALASNAALPEPQASAVLTSAAEITDLVEGWERLAGEREKVGAHHRGLERRTTLAEAEVAEARAQASGLGARLIALETELARARLAVARHEADREAEKRQFEAHTREMEVLKTQLEHAHQVISEMQATRIWRLGTGLWRFRARLFPRRGQHSELGAPQGPP